MILGAHISFASSETRNANIYRASSNWSGKRKALAGRRLTLVLFEFYLTVRKALTNSIQLSGGPADVSGFARSYRDAVPFGREELTTW